MTKDQIYHAQRILEKIKALQELYDEMMEKVKNIDKDSKPDEIFNFMVFIVKNGYKSMLFDTLINIRHRIEGDIAELEKELKEL